ncbi:Non-catalytic module family EXPN protein [Mycena amicta]|nr:Non-catalytic module family EXPN protein [Mycena amicta]
MFSLASCTVLALAITSSSAHSMSQFRRHLHVARASAPAGWDTGYLEDYYGYHSRYMAIGCENHHNTSFFDTCCHPLLSTETLQDNRPACCVPGKTALCLSTSTSSSAAAPASTGADDCEDEENDSGSNENDDDDDGEEDCEDEQDDDDSGPSTHHAPRTPESIAPEDTIPQAIGTSTKASSSSSNEFVVGGHSTWFTQNRVAGNCGTVHKDTDFIVALPTKAYENGAHCGRNVLIYDTSTGKSAEALVADSCPTCDNNECLDMSVALFEKFASLSVGEFPIKYQFLN